MESELETSEMRKRRLIAISFRFAITVLLGCVVGVLGWLSRVVTPVAGVLSIVVCIAFFTTLLVAVAWLFFLFSVGLRNPKIGMVVFATLFVWGSVSYCLCPVDVPDGKKGEELALANIVERQIEAPNRVIAAFFPSRGGFENLDRGNRVHYYIYHFFVVLFVAAMLFSIFGRGFVNSLRRFCGPSRGLNVFWNGDDESSLLACDILRTTCDKQVLVMLDEELRFDEDEFKLVTYRLDNRDIIWNCVNMDRVKKSDLRGRRHFFLGDLGHVNVGLADRLVKILRHYGKMTPDEVYFYIRIEANAEERVFLDWADRVKDTVTPIIIRESDMTARNFVRDYPMLDCPGIKVDTSTAMVSGSFRILLLGLGATGQSILREMVSNGQYVGTSGFSVDVLESDKAVAEAYEHEHAEAIEKYHISINTDVKAEGEGFEQFIAEHFREYNRIVVCLPGDEFSLRVASRLARFRDDHGVGPAPNVLFARVSDPGRHAYVKPPKGVTIFGNRAEVYSFSAIDADPTDIMAKVLNGEWENDKSDAGLDRAWKKASFANQQSSRASALGGRNHARTLGLEVVPLSDPRPEVGAEEFASLLNHDREMVLARNEHLRWNAYHRMLGYSCWDMNSPRIEDLPPRERKANQLESLGRHAALVDFDDLLNVDYRIACALNPENRERLKPSDFAEDAKVDVMNDGKRRNSMQAYDMLFVRKLGVNVAAAKMKLVRVGG